MSKMSIEEFRIVLKTKYDEMMENVDTNNHETEIYFENIDMNENANYHLYVEDVLPLETILDRLIWINLKDCKKCGEMLIFDKTSNKILVFDKDTYKQIDCKCSGLQMFRRNQ